MNKRIELDGNRNVLAFKYEKGRVVALDGGDAAMTFKNKKVRVEAGT